MKQKKRYEVRIRGICVFLDSNNEVTRPRSSTRPQETNFPNEVHAFQPVQVYWERYFCIILESKISVNVNYKHDSKLPALKEN